MAGLLADIFSYGDGLKRRLGGLLSDPMGTIDLGARRFNEDQDKLQQQAQDAGFLPGSRSVLQRPQDREQARRQFAEKALEAYGGLLGATGKFVYPQEKALKTAQANAAKPVSKGGLGLRPDNTPVERAKAMGFDTEAFHGSGQELKIIDNEKLRRNAYGKGLHSASDPELANVFAGHSGGGQNIAPLRLRVGNQASKQDYKDAMNQVWEDQGHNATEIRKRLMDKGFDTVTYNHGDFYYPNGGKLTPSLPNQDLSYASLVPSNVRSRFAAFDPARINDPDVLGSANIGLLGMIGAGTAGGLYLNEKKK